MRKVKVITDSCSDLTTELMERYGIDYARMNTVYNGVTSVADLAWTGDDVHSFYDKMRNGERITTTQVPADEFERIFRKYLDQDMDIVYVGCSLKQSGSVNAAQVVAKTVLQDHPEAKILSVNSLRASMGEGAIAIEAAKYAATGADADAVYEYTMDKRRKLNQFVTVHSLDALKRAGRVKASSAFFGNLLGVKPILIADAEGDQVGYKKVKGRAASIKEIVLMMKEAVKDPTDQTIYFAHSDCSQEEVETVKQLVNEEIGCKEIYVGYIGPIIGASIGPGALGLFAFGNEVLFRNGDK